MFSRLKRTDSQSLTVKILGQWVCVLCGTKCTSEEDMILHMSSRKHAENLAHKEARGDPLWAGDPTYSGFNFWITVKDLIPHYPLSFPEYSVLARTAVHCHARDVNGGSGRSDHIEPIAVSPVCADRTDTIRSFPPPPPGFFVAHYQRHLAIGQYFCEPCDSRFPNKTQYMDHLSSDSHVNTLLPFTSEGMDYFQPFVDAQTQRIMFVGLLSKPVSVCGDLYPSKHETLHSQWYLANRPPCRDSQIMQISLNDLIACFSVYPIIFVPASYLHQST